MPLTCPGSRISIWAPVPFVCLVCFVVKILWQTTKYTNYTKKKSEINTNGACRLRIVGCRLLEVRCSRSNPHPFSLFARSLSGFLDDNAADMRRFENVNVCAGHHEEASVPRDGDRLAVLDSDAPTIIQFEGKRLERCGSKHVPDFFNVHVV